jgi:signal transduction histidine kinase
MTESLNTKKSITVSAEIADGIVLISFANSGPEIPPDIMNRIFDPFFTTKEVGKGTGLGLSISYGIVANQGGKIYARNLDGKGVVFIIELPVNAH